MEKEKVEEGRKWKGKRMENEDDVEGRRWRRKGLEKKGMEKERDGKTGTEKERGCTVDKDSTGWRRMRMKKVEWDGDGREFR